MNKWDKEILKLKYKVSKLPPLTEKEERKLDLLADLLAEDFFAKLAEGKLRKPGKRGR